MASVNIHQAKAQLSALIARVQEQGERITICRYRRPVAELVPAKRGKRSRLDRTLRHVRIHTDLTADTAQDWENA